MSVVFGRARHRCAEALGRVARRLSALRPISAEDHALVLGLEPLLEDLMTGTELNAEGVPPRPRIVLSGWGCRSQLLADGRRQVLDIVVPGDLIGVSERVRPLQSAATFALGRVEAVDATPIVRAIAQRRRDHAGLAEACELACDLDEARLMAHVVRLGRQTAFERVAHFVLELHERMAAMGFADDQRFPLPLTQELMADALGLSVVHLNRVLQQMRREKLIELRGGTATLLDRDQLVLTADYASPVPAVVQLARYPSRLGGGEAAGVRAD